MAMIKFFLYGKNRNPVPIYLRFSAGRGKDYIIRSKLFVNPERWSDGTQSIKQRIRTNDDEKLIKNIKGLRDHIESAFKNSKGDLSKEWLSAKVDQYFNIKQEDDDTLNSYLAKFIQDAKSGNRKGKGGLNFAPGTIRTYEGFKRILNEYQGIYTEERIEEFKKKDNALRHRRIIDFEDISIDFYNDFVAFLSNEGYQVNTIGRFIKALKYIMGKALSEKKHSNRQFLEGAFSGFSEDSHAIYLTTGEVEKIYKHDLKAFPRMELARDAFIVLCETALRISDYKQIDISIKERDKKKYIHIYQTKTGDPVVIPLTSRMEAILKKYNGKLPRIPEQHVNKYIKSIASWCGITEDVSWPAQKFGKKYTASAKKYELITCHSGRRSACTNMYKAGLKPIDIMKISGHRSEKSFLTYIRITSEETAERLSVHPYFSGINLKAV